MLTVGFSEQDPSVNKIKERGIEIFFMVGVGKVKE